MSAECHKACLLRNELEIPWKSKDDLLLASKGALDFGSADMQECTQQQEQLRARLFLNSNLMSIDSVCLQQVSHKFRCFSRFPANSCTTLLATTQTPIPEFVKPIISAGPRLRPFILHSMHVALKHYQHSFPQDQEERRITLILDFISPEDGDRGFDITTYTEALPRPPLEPVEVKIGRCPPSRHGKVAKDAQVYPHYPICNLSIL